jgi:hypothetical protein
MKPDRDKNRDEHLLDGCLDEVLGARTPPDLTARIMQAWAMRRQSGVESDVSLPPLPGPPVETLPLEIAPLSTAVVRAVEPVPAVGSNGSYPQAVTASTQAASKNGEFAPVRTKSTLRSRRSASTWPWWAAATCVAGLGIALAIAANSQPNKPGPIAKPGKTDVVKPGTNGLAQNGNNTVPVKPTAKPGSLPGVPGNTVQPNNRGNGNSQIAKGNNGPKPMRPGVIPPLVSPEIRQPKPAPNVHELVEKKYDQAISDAEMVSYINATLAASWKENKVQPSPAASDEEWCRRVYLRLLGRIPTVDEVRSFARDKARDKREKLVATLMDGEPYAEQFASHWANVWTNQLVGRTLGGEAEQLASREGLEQYLRNSLAAKKPYYQIVYELLTAEGSAQPGSADFNGAVNFLVASMGKDGTLATARTSRVFLGQQLQCAQCHQHPTNEWGQTQYWAMNAFFRQTKIEQVAGVTRLTNEDFVDKKNVTIEGEVYFELPNGTIRATSPAFVDGTTIPPSGRLDEVNRRQELARLVVTSPQLSPALVNRVWSHYFGFGFTRPVDDIGPSNQPSHPELLAKVSEQFAAHNYDVRKLMKWLVLSDAFSRSSRITPNNLADAPEAGSVALFSHYYTRQMQAEEVYNSLLIAGDLRKKAGSQQDLAAARVDWLAQFNRPMGTDDSEEETHFNGAMRQSLIMMNGDLMRSAVSSGDGSFLQHLQESNLKPEEKVEHLFLAALSRPPSKRELEAVRTISAQLPDNPNAVLEDIWWGLLNSNEFILDH